MWFVIHVKPGKEAEAVAVLRSAPKSEGLDEVFSPMAHGIRGKDEDLEEYDRPLMDGCVFAVAPSKWELRACLRRAVGMDVLIDGDTSFEALHDGEEAFIDLLATPGKRTVPMSEGVVDHGRIVVRSGPLVGREGEIRKYSGRRRWAYLDAHVAGRPMSAQVGLRVRRDEARAGDGNTR